MKSLAEEIGERVRRRREALGLSRAELAQRSDLSEDALGLIERGENAPRVENLVRLSVALRVPVDALLGGRADGAGRRALALDRLIAWLERRPDRDIQMAHEIVRGFLGRRKAGRGRRGRG